MEYGDRERKLSLRVGVIMLLELEFLITQQFHYTTLHIHKSTLLSPIINLLNPNPSSNESHALRVLEIKLE